MPKTPPDDSHLPELFAFWATIGCTVDLGLREERYEPCFGCTVKKCDEQTLIVKSQTLLISQELGMKKSITWKSWNSTGIPWEFGEFSEFPGNFGNSGNSREFSRIPWNSEIKHEKESRG
jgi:hypothetical protein